MDRKEIAILAPCYSGDFDEETKECIKKASIELKDEFHFHDLTTKEVYIHRGRRMLLEDLLEFNKTQRFDYVLWLDSDVQFEPQQFKMLVEELEKNQLPCLSGIYFSRHMNHHPMFCYGDEIRGLNWDQKILIGKTFKVVGIGFGFFLLKMETIKKYCESYAPTQWFDSSGWYPKKENAFNQKYTYGEDVYFCKNMRQLGFPINVTCKVMVMHKGIGYQDYLAWKKKGIWYLHCNVKRRRW